MDTEEQRDYIRKTLQIYEQKYWLFQQQIAALGTQRNPSIDLEIQNIEKEIERLSALLIEVPMDLAAQRDIREKLVELSQRLSNEVARLYNINDEIIERVDDVGKIHLETWKALNAIIELIDLLGNTVVQSQHLSQSNDISIRLETILLLLIAAIIQFEYNSIVLTLIISLIMCALFCLVYVAISVVPLKRSSERMNRGYLERSKKRTLESVLPNDSVEQK